MSHLTWIQRNGFTSLNSFFPQLSQASQIVVVTHSSLLNLYSSSWLKTLKQFYKSPLIIEIPVGESSKNLAQAMRCWEYLARNQVDRQAALIGIGGGVICDLTGFIASNYMRGIDSYYVPTSLMAMVDAALGGKTGINACGKKNLIGTFYPPKAVLIDPSYLKTLPKREINSGLAEVIKYGIIEEPKLLTLLEKNKQELEDPSHHIWDELINYCVIIKNKIVKQDPLDKLNIRACLNYGHTFGHAFESMTRYRTYSHGEAVAIGMSCAAHLSLKMGLTDSQTVDYQDYLLNLFNLPLNPPKLNTSRFIQLMKSDKKGIYGKISLILPERIGKVLKVADVDPILIQQTLLAKMK